MRNGSGGRVACSVNAMSVAREPADAWNAEYRNGRYRDDAPVAFVDDILAAARHEKIATGLYIGCGNGRNLLPLVDGGLDLVGLDVSDEAIRQLAAARPERADRLVVGDLAALPADRRWPLVIGIQVFQHGDRRHTHDHIRAARRRVRRGGLLCVRVNAAGTDVSTAHEVVEEDADGGFSVRYTAGPKAGLVIHFFGGSELDALCAGWAPVLARRAHRTQRAAPGTGQWTQWEAIWRRDRGPR
jgi:hypothetical protein